MKKLLVSIVLIGASALYIFTRSSDAATSVAVTPSTVDTSSITISPAPIIKISPPQSKSAADPAPQPVQTMVPPRSTVQMMNTMHGYKDGTFAGSVADAYYGLVQVQAIIKNGIITNVTFLSYPNDRSTSVYINSQATPMLAQEAIQAQSANVNIVSGATATSEAFQQSLGVALASAKN